MLGPNQSPDMSDFQIRRLILRLDKVISSDPKVLDDAVGDITAELDATACWGGHEPDVETIGLAVREAIANAIVHGNHCNSETMVRISVAVNENCDLLVSVKDSGAGFDPRGLPNPIASENILVPHGRGIFIMRQIMDEVDFKFDHGTEVRMRLGPERPG
jgi:anti-sigma regulatory factor (Ser/Thr protein kinase)